MDLSILSPESAIIRWNSLYRLLWDEEGHYVAYTEGYLVYENYEDTDQVKSFANKYRLDYYCDANFFTNREIHTYFCLDNPIMCCIL
jgi:hypothetical protein